MWPRTLLALALGAAGCCPLDLDLSGLFEGFEWGTGAWASRTGELRVDAAFLSDTDWWSYEDEASAFVVYAGPGGFFLVATAARDPDEPLAEALVDLGAGTLVLERRGRGRELSSLELWRDFQVPGAPYDAPGHPVDLVVVQSARHAGGSVLTALASVERGTGPLEADATRARARLEVLLAAVTLRASAPAP